MHLRTSLKKNYLLGALFMWTFAAVGTIAAQCVLPVPGLVSWWSADGSTADIFGGNPGLPTANGVLFAPGMVGQAFSFDGTNGYIQTTLDVQPNAMPYSTWEAWIYPTRSYHPTHQIILGDDNGGFDRSVEITPNTNTFGIFQGTGIWQPVVATFNEWQHIAVVFSPTNILFYKNGLRYSYGSAPSGQLTARRLFIGKSPRYPQYFQGLVDEVAIYNRVLSSNEIAAIYAAGSEGKCKPVSPTDVIYSNDFERLDTEANWFPLAINKNPYGNRQFLGPFGNTSASLSLTNLPTHTNLTLAFDLMLFNSWDGNDTPGPDYFDVNVDGTQTLLHTTFRNDDPSGPQSYPGTYRSNDFPGLTGALEVDTLGYPEDSVYHLNFSFPHSSNAVHLNFQGANLQAITDESWGLDNVILVSGAPTVAITEPANGGAFISPTNLLINVNVSSSAAPVSQVILLDNHILLGILTNSPYTLVWSNVPAGIHVLTARAIDEAAKAAEATITLKVNGLQGEYFANTNLAGLNPLKRRDTEIKFNWVGGSPMTGIGADRFSIKWTGEILPRYSNTYTFYTTNNDGARLWIDGRRIIDDWKPHSSPVTNSGTITLQANQRYEVQLEYWENTGNASVELEWQSGSQSREVVPASHLFPPDGENRPPNAPVIIVPKADGFAISPTNELTMAVDFFSDPNTGQAQLSAEWEIYRANIIASNLVWYSYGTNASTLLTNHLSNGTFTNALSSQGRLSTADYILRVRHQDNSGSTNSWGNWTERVFTTKPPAFVGPSIDPPYQTNLIIIGDTVSLSITNVLPIGTYHWQFNGLNIPGATNSILILSNFQSGVNYEGDYRIVVSNASGDTISPAARLTASYLQLSGIVWDDRNANGIVDVPVIRGTHPDIVFVIDRSHSTSVAFLGDPTGDVNGDGIANSRLDAELSAFIALNKALISHGYTTNTRIGVVDFGNDAVANDLNPVLAGTQFAVAPDSDSNTNHVNDVEEVLHRISINAVGGTDFHHALQMASNVFAGLSTTPNNGNVIFLSDGESDLEGNLYTNDVVALTNNGIHLRAFGAGSDATLATLRLIDRNAQIFTNSEHLVEFFGGPTGSLFDKELGLAGVTLYLDLNNNGQLDPGEPTTISQQDDPLTFDEDETGRYCFTNLTAGTKIVRELLPNGFAFSFPISTNGGYVTNSHSAFTSGIDFGNTRRSGLGLSISSSGDVILALTRPEGINHRIEISSDLRNWTTLTNVSGTNVTIIFTDPTAVTQAQRFYRAVQR